MADNKYLSHLRRKYLHTVFYYKKLTFEDIYINLHLDLQCKVDELSTADLLNIMQKNYWQINAFLNDKYNNKEIVKEIIKLFDFD